MLFPKSSPTPYTLHPIPFPRSLFLTLFLIQLTSPVLAQAVLNISTSHAEGRTSDIPKLTVWSGSGLSLNFVSTGEHIVKAWLDDPSKLTLDFDAPLCESPCESSAKIIHLRRIEPLQFSHLPSASSTLLTVVTEGGQEKKVYYFKLNYGNGQPKYIAVNINTDTRRLLPQRQQPSQVSLKERTERIEQGLKIAKQQDTSGQNELVFERVEALLIQVRSGLSFNEAIKRTNLSPSVLFKLETLATNSGGLN